IVLSPQFEAWVRTVFQAMRFSALYSLTLAAGWLILSWGYQRRVIGIRPVKHILLVLLLINLWWPSYNKESTYTDQELKDFRTPLIQQLQRDPELFRVYVDKSITELIKNTPASQLGDILPLYKKLLLHNTGEISHIYCLDAYEAIRPLYPANLNKLLITSPALSATPILTLLNSKYALSLAPLTDRNFVPVARIEEMILYRHSKYLPRVAVIPRAVFITDEEALYRKFIDNFDPATEILLEGTSPGSMAPGRGRVELLRYDPSEILLQACIESEQAWVLLADAYFPGWQASIDGIPAKIYKADYALRGVSVPVGKHMVKFQYSPWSFKLGLFTFLAALFVLSLLGLRFWRGVRSDQWGK
ncbi:MAG: YfhO family protein, partial [bacterium]|nr:YfhO family protein [bacterium]